MEKSKIETIIWDLDGTIFDSFDMFCDSLEVIGPKHDFVVPDRQYIKQHFHGGLTESMMSILNETDETRINALIDDFLLHQQDGHINPDDNIYADAKRLVERAALNRVAQIIVTNRRNTMRNDSPSHIIANSTLNGKFVQIVSRDEGEYNKPDARVMDLVEHVYNPSTTAVIGDQFVDAQLAINLKVHAILINRDGHGIPHLERLGEGWEQLVQVVDTLDEVEL